MPFHSLPSESTCAGPHAPVKLGRGRFAVALAIATTTGGVDGARARPAAPPVLPEAPPILPEAPPILDDLERARAFGPPPGTLDPAPEVKPGETPEEDSQPFVRIAGYGRWAGLPKFAFGLAFEESTDLSSAAAGAALEFGDLEGSVWAFSFDWTALTPKAGNWNEFFSDPPDATYVESNLHMLSIDVSYRNNLPFTRWMRAVFGGGLGVGYLLGDIATADVLPTCVDPVSTCAHWPASTTDKVGLPTRIVPVLHFSGGLEFDLGDQLALRFEAGFRDVFYAGVALGFYL